MGGVIASVLLASSLIASADTSISSWLEPSNLTLQKQATASSIPPAWNGNIDCFEEKNGTCVINTAYGSVNSSAYARLGSTADYHPVISYMDYRQHFIPIPNSNMAITYTTEPVYGLYLYFNYDFASSIKTVDYGAGPEYQIVKAPNGKLADKTNHRLAADYASISFSENGRWMVVTDPNVATLRVNLQTFDVLPFGPGFNYSNGQSPAPQTAITNDGRYAVVASKDFNSFSIYDLSTCSAVPDTISGPVSCRSRDLRATMQQIPGYIGSSHLRFIGDGVMSLYAGSNGGGTHKTTRYLLANDSGIVHQQDYLALGDSYISGEGADDYLQGTDTTDNQCHVSLLSYPYLLGQELNYSSYHSVACSGATTNDIINTSDKYKAQAKPHKIRQVLNIGGQVPKILTDFQQGYIDQLDFVKTYQPKVITVSVGGNDMGFSQILKPCVTGLGTCYSTYEDRVELVRQINTDVFNKLVQTYADLKNAGPPDMRIYAIGYPQIAKLDGDCALNVHLDNDEILFSQLLVSYLDNVIQQAASRTGVVYVDTQNALYGHRLCEAGPGSVAMNGLTAGNNFPLSGVGPIGNESYHPNAFGYQLLENAILLATHNLTDTMPSPNLDAAPPSEAGQAILDAPHSGRAINVTEYDPGISVDIAYKQVPLDVSIDGSTHLLNASSALRAELHSTPISLGNFTTDLNGNLSAQVTIPTTVPAGYHVLHFYGIDLTSQPIDIYKTIYVARTADDLDGNNIPDSQQACVGVAPSGQDYDQDGVDDACDNNISQPSSLPSPNEPSSTPVIGAPLVTSASNPISDQPQPVDPNSPSPATPVSQTDILGESTGDKPVQASVAGPAGRQKIWLVAVVGGVIVLLCGRLLFARGRL